MTKTATTATLSKNSFKNVADYLESYKKAIQEGSRTGVEKVTFAMFEAVKAYCYAEGIEFHTDAVKWDYNKETNIGKVYTDDLVLVFNEMGTGVVGKNSPHPKPSKGFEDWEYDVNKRGEKGWKYPKPDGTYGWTRGLPSRHMFYSAFNQIKDMALDNISIEITKKAGKLYGSKNT